MARSSRERRRWRGWELTCRGRAKGGEGGFIMNPEPDQVGEMSEPCPWPILADDPPPLLVRLGSIRTAGHDVLAAAARLLGAGPCSSQVEAAAEQHRAQQGAAVADWQVAECSMFAVCCCAEGTWGMAQAAGGSCGGPCSPEEVLRRLDRMEAACSAVVAGAPEDAPRRLASLWHITWLSASVEPMLRPGARLVENRRALEVALRCLKVTDRAPPLPAPPNPRTPTPTA